MLTCPHPTLSIVRTFFAYQLCSVNLCQNSIGYYFSKINKKIHYFCLLFYSCLKLPDAPDSTVVMALGSSGGVVSVSCGGWGASDDVLDHDESSFGRTSVVSPTGYSLTNGLRARECWAKAT